MKNLIFTLIILSGPIFSQIVFSAEDSSVCMTKFKIAVEDSLLLLPTNRIIAEIGKSFIGTDYVAGTLEAPGEEKLIINLSGLDCYTFVEAVTALSRCIKRGDTSSAAFADEIRLLRYRDGKISGYISRLHYFTDWIYEMGKAGIIKDRTKLIGGTAYKKDIHFMSSNWEKYPKLKECRELVPKIKEIEKAISTREYYYIYEDELEIKQSRIQEGNLIAITTGIEGLDISHVGIAVKVKGKIHLLHAPVPGKKVQITEIPLADYILKNKKQTGVMVIEVL